ncbi:MAG: acyl-CoA dehydrogenase family protein, partial [Burkholderiales bacterium]
MTTRLDTDMRAGSGRFLVGDTTPDAVFTREDLSEEQRLFGQAAEEFMRTEVVPRAAEIYAKNWPLTRELIRKAADRDFTRLEIPEAYGGLGQALGHFFPEPARATGDNGHAAGEVEELCEWTHDVATELIESGVVSQ